MSKEVRSAVGIPKPKWAVHRTGEVIRTVQLSERSMVSRFRGELSQRSANRRATSLGNVPERAAGQPWTLDRLSATAVIHRLPQRRTGIDLPQGCTGVELPQRRTGIHLPQRAATVDCLATTFDASTTRIDRSWATINLTTALIDLTTASIDRSHWATTCHGTFPRWRVMAGRWRYVGRQLGDLLGPTGAVAPVTADHLTRTTAPNVRIHGFTTTAELLNPTSSRILFSATQLHLFAQTFTH